MIGQLRELLLQYVAGEIGYEPFREQFVSRFLAASDRDPLVGYLYAIVESECSARGQQFIDEVRLKERLFKLTSQIVIQNLSPQVHVVMNQSNVGVSLYRPAANDHVQVNSLVAYTTRNSASYEEA